MNDEITKVRISDDGLHATVERVKKVTELVYDGEKWRHDVGATPSVIIDDDSASCPSGISDSIKINLGPEGGQE